MRQRTQTIILLILLASFAGCSSNAGNIGQIQSYPFSALEAKWIRDGEPLDFEGELWYPTDELEALLDPEVLLLGEYKGVQFFVEKADVKPYNHLYTKFGRNKFRSFIKRKPRHDPDITTDKNL